MKIILNGERFESKSGGSLTKLLKEAGAVDSQIAILVNDEVVPRNKRSGFKVKDGDSVELLSFAGGG